MTINRKTSFTPALLTLSFAASITLAAMSGAAAQTKKVVTIWSWNAALPTVEKEFEAANPDIDLNIVPPGGPPEQYLKFRNAIRAGTGVPDLVHLPLAMLPSFKITGALADLSSFGLGQHKGDYAPWIWELVNTNGKIFSLPWDTGPMALWYRQDIFDKYGLTVPKTWADFEKQARILAEKSDGIYMTNMNLNQDWIQAMFWQAGARLFEVDGTKVKVNIDNEKTRSVLTYWERLRKDGLVDSSPGYVTDWFASMDAGRYATWPGPRWAVTTLTRTASAGRGQWRVAPMPQWDEAKPVATNLGGSVLVVPQLSQNKEAAVKALVWLMNGPGADLFFDRGLWPTKLGILESPAVSSQKNEIFGDQQANPIFAEAAKNVEKSWQFSPFQDYVDARFSDELSAAAAGKGSMVDALPRLQKAVTTYAEEQGFTVSK